MNRKKKKFKILEESKKQRADLEDLLERAI